MDIEQAFKQLTGDTNDRVCVEVKGTTKADVRDLCGNDWNEKAWNRMVRYSQKGKSKSIGSVPFYDRDKKLWFWY